MANIVLQQHHEEAYSFPKERSLRFETQWIANMASQILVICEVERRTNGSDVHTKGQNLSLE